MREFNELIKYTEMYGKGALREICPDIPDSLFDFLYYSPVPASGLIYFDPDKKILFETRAFFCSGHFIFLKPDGMEITFTEAVDLTMKAFQKEMETGHKNYVLACMVPPDYAGAYAKLLEI